MYIKVRRNILLIFFLFFCDCLMAVELKSHQKYAIDFLQNRPNQKGLLIYHGLGTGKTYLSIGFCEKYQKKKVIDVQSICVPC